MDNEMDASKSITGLLAKARQKDRDKISLQTEEFLAKGNKIEVIKSRVSSGIFEKVSFNSTSNSYAS